MVGFSHNFDDEVLSVSGLTIKAMILLRVAKSFGESWVTQTGQNECPNGEYHTHPWIDIHFHYLNRFLNITALQIFYTIQLSLRSNSDNDLSIGDLPSTRICHVSNDQCTA